MIPAHTANAAPRRLALPRLAWDALPLLAALALAACPPPNQCVAGQSAQCFCADGTAGAQVCDDDGRFGPCSCEQSDGGTGDTDGGTGDTDGGTGDTDGGTDTDGGVERTECEQMCFHVYVECERTFNNTQGSPISQTGCVTLCDGGSFTEGEVDCFTAAECTSAALDACFGVDECPAIADCAGRECGPDPICDASCGSCDDLEACSGSGQCAATHGWVTELAGSDLPDDFAIAVDSTGTVHAAVITDDGDLLYGRRTAAGTFSMSLVEAVGNQAGFGLGQEVSLVLDADGRPHLAYRDEGQGRLRYASRTGSSWRIETADPGVTAGEFASMVLDAAGLPHIGYLDAATKAVWYARRDAAGNWSRELVDESGTGSPAVGIGLDAAGRPHLAYPMFAAYPGPGSGLRYAFHDGTAWQTEDVFSGAFTSFVSFGLAADGTPHIAFFIRDARVVRHATRGATEWAVVDVDNVGNGNAWTCLEVAADGAVHLAYVETAQSRLKYGRYAAGAWTLETADTTPGSGIDCDLALSPDGQMPWVLYKTTDYRQLTKLAHRVP